MSLKIVLSMKGGRTRWAGKPTPGTFTHLFVSFTIVFPSERGSAMTTLPVGWLLQTLVLVSDQISLSRKGG